MRPFIHIGLDWILVVIQGAVSWNWTVDARRRLAPIDAVTQMTRPTLDILSVFGDDDDDDFITHMLTREIIQTSLRLLLPR